MPFAETKEQIGLSEVQKNAESLWLQVLGLARYSKMPATDSLKLAERTCLQQIIFCFGNNNTEARGSGYRPIQQEGANQTNLVYKTYTEAVNGAGPSARFTHYTLCSTWDKGGWSMAISLIQNSHFHQLTRVEVTHNNHTASITPPSWHSAGHDTL